MFLATGTVSPLEQLLLVEDGALHATVALEPRHCRVFRGAVSRRGLLRVALYVIGCVHHVDA